MSVLALLDVMDKEPSLGGTVVTAVSAGVAGLLLARRWPWSSVPLVLLYGVVLWAIVSEVHDPYVGSAIASEAGELYAPLTSGVWILAIVLVAIGFILGRRRQGKAREAERVRG